MPIKRLTAVITLSAALLAVVLLLNLSVQAAPLERPQVAPPWNASVRVNDTAAAGAVERRAPALAASSSVTLYAVWQDARNGDADIYSARSTDAGQTWGNIVRVNRDVPGRDQFDPDVAINAAGTLHAVWQDSGIYYARSADGGRSWSAEAVKISDGSALAFDPAIAVYTNTVCAAWVDANDVHVDCSTDNGLTWDTDLTAPAVSGQQPDLVIDSGGQAHVAWTDNRNGNLDIDYARWSPSKSWSGATQLNTDAGSAAQQHPALALNGSALVVGWLDNRSGSQVYARYSANTGTTWSGSDAPVSDAGNVVGAPAFTAGRGGLWATWIVLSGTDTIAYADTGTSTWGVDDAITTTTESRLDAAAAGNASYVWAG